ncbi:MAG: polysaccharide deacetylase family protein [Lachnospiraceae bacterium]|nr:polysaccharide deacetylase family protein [Lachnospiraceae bacterium]MBQ8232859.1 polysaccharide deacetylase family protein [Lachnospiraceae bacterium]
MATIFMRFPEGKAKAVTLSYDDGVEQDIRLIEIMKVNGLKGTFNINTGRYAEEGKVFDEGVIHRRMSKSLAQKTYLNSGMEVAVHALTHPFLEWEAENVCTYEVLQDRKNIEEDFGGIVRGMAYPFGTYNDSVVATLKQCGIVYSRTVQSTERFDIPTDWLRLPATCHHNNPRLMELAHQFVESPVRNPWLFYLWGHSYEFEQRDNWNVIEEFAEYIGNREEIWYATNIEIYDYIAAYKQLQFSVEQKVVYNPTAMTLYFERNGQKHCIKSGEVRML